MPRFSANLGFLWTDRPLPDAIRAAGTAGFDAVECHWPYDIPVDEVRAALEETGLPMLGINTRRGNVDLGENGLAALPGRASEARDAIVEALEYAQDIGAGSVHVMAGVSDGAEAHEIFVENLIFAADRARESGTTILIEPLNPFDAPGFFLNTTDQARAIIKQVGAPNLKLMFDCYHVGRTEGDILARFRNLLPIIGHIQFASVPDRGRPDQGDVSYSEIFAAIDQSGWNRPLGAEYKPGADTDESLSWMNRWR